VDHHRAISDEQLAHTSYSALFRQRALVQDELPGEELEELALARSWSLIVLRWIFQHLPCRSTAIGDGDVLGLTFW
jgi:hypothetical protein